MELRRSVTIVVAALCLGVGCGQEATVEVGAGAPASSVVASESMVKRVADLGAELGFRLAPAVESVREAMSVPGTVVHVRTPHSRWEKAFGTRAAGMDDPVTVDDHFRVGSTTKTMIGTVMLQLVSEGLIALDDPVARYLPEVPNGANITVRQLLDMRSGLFSYSELLSFNKVLDSDPARVWQPTELARLGWAEAPYFAPGAAFRYSNTNTILAGLIIERLTGQQLASVLSQRVFGPLGLAETSFPALTDASLPTPSTRGHLFGTNVSASTSTALPEDQVDAARLGTLLPNDVTSLNPSWIGAAGAAISTAGDLATYAEELVVGDALLGADLQGLRLASVAGRDRTNPLASVYGLAWMTFGPLIGHDGAISGFQTFMGHDPDTGITVVVLCNLGRDGPAGGRPANEIANAIIRSLYQD